MGPGAPDPIFKCFRFSRLPGKSQNNHRILPPPKKWCRVQLSPFLSVAFSTGCREIDKTIIGFSLPPCLPPSRHHPRPQRLPPARLSAHRLRRHPYPLRPRKCSLKNHRQRQREFRPIGHHRTPRRRNRALPVTQRIRPRQNHTRRCIPIPVIRIQEQLIPRFVVRHITPRPPINRRVNQRPPRLQIPRAPRIPKR